MKHILFIFLCIPLFSCGPRSNSTDPAEYLTKEAQEDFKYSISRYIHRLPKTASENTKFHPEFDEEYRRRSEGADLLFYHEKEQSGEIYFAIAKIAPSLTLKKVVTAGKLKKNKAGAITAYEEEFRTWKMEEGEMLKISEMLFKTYIEGGDLSPYYTHNANGKFIIEFPDEFVSYDKENRIWISKRKDPLEEYYELKQGKPKPEKP